MTPAQQKAIAMLASKDIVSIRLRGKWLDSSLREVRTGQSNPHNLVFGLYYLAHRWEAYGCEAYGWEAYG